MAAESSISMFEVKLICTFHEKIMLAEGSFLKFVANSAITLACNYCVNFNACNDIHTRCRFVQVLYIALQWLRL